MDDFVGLLGVPQQVHEQINTLQARINLRLRPAREQLRLDASELSKIAVGHGALDCFIAYARPRVLSPTQVQDEAIFVHPDLVVRVLVVGHATSPLEPAKTPGVR